MNDGWMDGATVGSGHAFIDSGGHDSVCQPPYMTTAHPPEWKNFIALAANICGNYTHLLLVPRSTLDANGSVYVIDKIHSSFRGNLEMNCSSSKYL